MFSVFPEDTGKMKVIIRDAIGDAILFYDVEKIKIFIKNGISVNYKLQNTH